MDGLDIEERISNGQPQSSSNLHKLNAHDAFNNVKTPGRGLGMIVNQTKTPCSQMRNFNSEKSTAKIERVSAPQFDVFEDFSNNDDEEPELKKLEFCESEENFAKESDEIEQIERPSRMPYRSCSISELHQEKLAELDDVVLFDDTALCFLEAEALAELGDEPWEEYPPIEQVSRWQDPNYFVIENTSDNVVLVDDYVYTKIEPIEPIELCGKEELEEWLAGLDADFDEWWDQLEEFSGAC